MKVSDYIVFFLIEKGITDVFGYPGGMVTHLMDSFYKYRKNISAHVNYHEQGAAFCACGYAQASNRPGVAYATSGPGATNLITGIANAYFDSIPCVFITGQVNTYEGKKDLHVRQKGFQETDIVDIVKSITKYAVKIENKDDIRYEIEKAFYISCNGRPGPVLLDIPMNIQRDNIIPDSLKGYIVEVGKINNLYYDNIKDIILDLLYESKKPVILAGNGINSSNTTEEFRRFTDLAGIPVVTSMIGRDIFPEGMNNYFGFIGAYGNREANFIISNSDLIISFGSRMDSRQTGYNLKTFAKDAKIVRIDIDEGELTNKIKDDEISIIADLKNLMPIFDNEAFRVKGKYEKWINACKQLRKELRDIDSQNANDIIKTFSYIVPDNFIITTDVGQNQVWVAQSFSVKNNQRILFSGGHGAMGYSLPAAIGAYYGTRKKVVCFSGDGGFQMNIQELQFVVRENIPIKIVLLNNSSLGMIRHFQEMYFDSNYAQTQKHSGYTVPDFEKISYAYGLRYMKVRCAEEVLKCEEMLCDDKPCVIEIILEDNTYLYPKLAQGRPIYDQDPLLERSIFNNLIDICNL